MPNYKCRVEFYSETSKSWLAAHHDFDCANVFENQSNAQAWIAAQNDFERSDGAIQTTFRIVPA